MTTIMPDTFPLPIYDGDEYPPQFDDEAEQDEDALNIASEGEQFHLAITIDDFTLGAQQLFFDTDTLVDPATGKTMTSAQRRAFVADLHFPQTLTVDSALVKQFGVLNSGFSRRLDPHRDEFPA